MGGMIMVAFSFVRLLHSTRLASCRDGGKGCPRTMTLDEGFRSRGACQSAQWEEIERHLQLCSPRASFMTYMPCKWSNYERHGLIAFQMEIRNVSRHKSLQWT